MLPSQVPPMKSALTPKELNLLKSMPEGSIDPNVCFAIAREPLVAKAKCVAIMGDTSARLGYILYHLNNQHIVFLGCDSNLVSSQLVRQVDKHLKGFRVIQQLNHIEDVAVENSFPEVLLVNPFFSSA